MDLMTEIYKHVAYKLSAKRKINLEKLARLLERRIEPPKFEMSSFMSFNGYWMNNMGHALQYYKNEFDEKGNEAAVYNHCGTSACAIGHGPLAGIRIKKTEDWSDYSARVFIDQYKENGGVAWGFLFSGSWSDYDNTPSGAAARIWYFLKNGAPANRSGDVDYRNIDFYQDYKLGGPKHPDAVKEVSIT